MRRVIAFIILSTALLVPAQAATSIAEANASSTEAGLRMIKDYREKPDPRSVPQLIRALSEHGAFKDPETSGVYLGFYAGVLSTNPRTAKSLLAKTLPLPFEDQWFIVRAVAYSGLPNWRALMLFLVEKMPERHVMIEMYLNGKLPTLDKVKLEQERESTWDKMKRVFDRETYTGKGKKKPPQLTFASNPELIDTNWGLYFATARDAPVEHIVRLLPWSKERDNVQKLTIGGMAKFTLAANAARDANLLRTLKRLSMKQPKDVEPILGEVIIAAETADTGRIRKEALASVDQLQKKGPGSNRELAWWGQVGETTLSLGCLGAAVAGQAEFGIPCVVGGALSTAALRYLASP